MCVLFIGSQRIGTVHCLVYRKPESLVLCVSSL